jgi:hypothetical protein
MNKSIAASTQSLLVASTATARATGKAMSTDMNSRYENNMSRSSINSMDECRVDEATDSPIDTIDGTPAREPGVRPPTHSD